MLKGELKKLYNKLDKVGYRVEELEYREGYKPEIKVYPFVANNDTWLEISFWEDSGLFIIVVYSNKLYDHTVYFKKLSSVVDLIENN